MLEIKELKKGYSDGDVLCGVSLCLDKKGIYGILGKKGSGKSVLARLMCGCEDADSGEILLNGEPVSRKALALKRKIRLVPTALEIDGMMNAVEYLDFVGTAMGVPSEKRYRQIKEAIELCELSEFQYRSFSRLLKMQKARLSLAASLIGNPDVIVLDAPFGVQFAEVKGVLKMLSKIKTVVLLSHRTAEIRELCDSVSILHGGKIAVSGSIDEIERMVNAEQRMFITVRGNKDKICEAVRAVEGVVSIKQESTKANNVGTYAVEHTGAGATKDRLYAALSAIDAPMLSVKEEKLTFEDVFYSLTSGGDQK